MLYFIKPTNLLDATVRGGVSTGSAIIGAAPLLMAMNANPNSWEMHLCAGAVIGFLSWGVLSMIARFFIKAAENNEDIVDAVKKFKK